MGKFAPICTCFLLAKVVKDLSGLWFDWCAWSEGPKQKSGPRMGWTIVGSICNNSLPPKKKQHRKPQKLLALIMSITLVTSLYSTKFASFTRLNHNIWPVVLVSMAQQIWRSFPIFVQHSWGPKQLSTRSFCWFPLPWPQCNGPCVSIGLSFYCLSWKRGRESNVHILNNFRCSKN